MTQIARTFPDHPAVFSTGIVDIHGQTEEGYPVPGVCISPQPLPEAKVEPRDLAANFAQVVTNYPDDLVSAQTNSPIQLKTLTVNQQAEKDLFAIDTLLTATLRGFQALTPTSKSTVLKATSFDSVDESKVEKILGEALNRINAVYELEKSAEEKLAFFYRELERNMDSIGGGLHTLLGKLNMTGTRSVLAMLTDYKQRTEAALKS